MLWISPFVLFMLFSIPPISFQLQLQCPHSIGLCVWKQNGDYTASLLPPSCSPSLLFYTHWQVHVPWQRPWRHRWLDEPPCSGLLSTIIFAIESWEKRRQVAQRHRVCLKRGRGKKNHQVSEWDLQHSARAKSSTGLCWVSNSMFMPRAAAEVKSIDINYLELDGHDAVRQETCLLDCLGIYAWRWGFSLNYFLPGLFFLLYFFMVSVIKC